MSHDILASIADYKRGEVRARKALVGEGELISKARAAPSPRGFREALVKAWAPGGLALIAEIKKASPSRGVIRPDFDPAEIAKAYEAGGASCLSVLTDTPSFQGRDENLTLARAATNLPCLRKDFLVDEWQVAESRALGADAILVILALVDDSLARALMAAARDLSMDALVETHDEREIDRAGALGANLVGINNRDLRTFSTDLATTEKLSSKVATSALIITESGISSPGDVGRLARAGAKAMLVGESLMRHPDIEAATRALLG